MTIVEIATEIAKAAAPFGVRAEDLLEMVRAELGNALDEFVVHGKNRTRAFGPSVLLHILSGNTPNAALQSIVRGLLLRSHNLCKLPSSGLPEIEAFHKRLPASLGRKIEFSHALPDSWMAQADAIVVFGDDSTIEHFRKRTRANQRFIGHGHKVSFGIIFEDPAFSSVAAAAADASLFDQQGCLSPHLFYVGDNPRGYAAALAREMEAFDKHTPRRALLAGEAAAIAALREEFAFGIANGSSAQLYASRGSSAWTVIFDPDPRFRPSCLNRVVYIKPFPQDWQSALEPVKDHLSTIGFWPPDSSHAELLTILGATRFCPVGKMQAPPWTWHQDGIAPLSSLVRWVDFET